MTTRTANSPYVCGWSFDDGCSAKLAAAFLSQTPADVTKAQQAVDQAAEVLYALSGRQFGVCQVTARPCRQSCCEPCGRLGMGNGLRWIPLLSGGVWTNISCTSCKTGCSCTAVCEVQLPGPVDHIVQVRLDGVLLDPTEYRVDNRRNLVRLGAAECWPTCQDMNLEATEVGTFEVIYGKGHQLPVAGQVALGALASELYKACSGDKDCGLPERVTTIVRQGIAMTLLDPMEFLTGGRSGIYAVDLWLATVNPKGRARHAGVFSPDVTPARTTGSGSGSVGPSYGGY